MLYPVTGYSTMCTHSFGYPFQVSQVTSPKSLGRWDVLELLGIHPEATLDEPTATCWFGPFHPGWFRVKTLTAN